MKLFLFTILLGATCLAATVQHSGSQSTVSSKIIPSTVSWASLASGDNGAAVQIGNAATISVQFSGTFTITTVVLEGSNDGTTYYTIDDIEGTAISKTAAGQMEVRDRPKYIRPRISVGGVSTDVTAVMYLSK